MKVALSTSVIQRGKSGIATYVFGLLEGFRQLGNGPEFHLLGLAADRPLFERWKDLFRWIEVPKSCRPALRDVLWHQTTLRGVLRREGIDVLHIPSYRRAVWNAPCAQMVTVHDLAAFKFAGKYDALRMAYGRHAVPRLLRTAQMLATVSHSTAADLAAFGGGGLPPVRVIWNGIDHGHFRPQDAAAVDRVLGPAWPGGVPPYFIYIARLEHPAKNHVRLIAAFEDLAARHPDLHLVIGGADWHGAAVVHQRIADSPVRSRIRHLGFVSLSDLPAWYAGARALVFPSLFEGFGFPPLEAMACGCPVVSSTEGSLGEILGPAAVRVDARDVASLAAGMRQVMDWSAARRREAIDAGAAHAAGFTWRDHARETMECYLLARARGAAHDAP